MILYARNTYMWLKASSFFSKISGWLSRLNSGRPEGILGSGYEIEGVLNTQEKVLEVIEAFL
jgi:hypothetical protein